MKRTESEITDIIGHDNTDRMAFSKYHYSYRDKISEYETEPRLASDSIYYSDLTDDSKGTSPFFTNGYFGNSDYAGGTVEKSNCKEWKELYGKYENIVWWFVYGDYSSQTILFDARHINADMIETLNALSDYPVISDESISELEMELENEYVPMDILPTIIEQVEDIFKVEEIDLNNTDFNDLLWTAYREIMETSNTYPIFETGGNCYIDTDIFTTVESRKIIHATFKPTINQVSKTAK